MKVLLVHIGDLHMRKDGVSFFRDKSASLAGAIRSVDTSFDSILLINTGDIAFSGEQREFHHAQKILKEINEALKPFCKGAAIQEIHVPGNHDCSLPKPQELQREQFVKSLVANLDYLQPGHPLYDHSFHHQDQFFQFEAQRAKQKKREGWRLLHDEFQIATPAGPVSVGWINSSWLSQLREKAGSLAVTSLPSAKSHSDSLLRIVVMHHPPGWFQPQLQRKIRANLLKDADILFVGHEHESFTTSILDPSNNSYVHIDGGALDPGDSSSSSFGFVIIDTDGSTLSHYVCDWRETHYHVELRLQTRLAGSANQNSIRMSDAGLAFLSDPGMPLSHPRRENLLLEDIFVYPDLDIESIANEDKDELVVKTINASEFDRTTVLRSVRLISGSERAGKSALLRTIAASTYDAHKFPVFLRGDSISSSDPKQVVALIRENLTFLYGALYADQLLQHTSEKLTLFVDDWHLCPLNNRRRNDVLRIFMERFHIVYLSCSPEWQLEWFKGLTDNSLLSQISPLSIRELGRKLKGSLVSKWILLGQEQVIDEDMIGKEVDSKIRLLLDVVGRNLLPHYPFFLLSILHLLESKSDHAESSLGTFGYHCEMLVKLCTKRSVDEMNSGGKAIKLDTLLTVLSVAAYQSWINDEYVFEREQFYAHVRLYNNEYAMTIGASEVLDALTKGNVLRKVFEDKYQFSYPLLRHYFIANMFAMNVNRFAARDEALQQIRRLVSNLHVESNASIVVLFTYLTKNEEVVREIVRAAENIFKEEPICDIESATKQFMIAIDLDGLPVPDGNLAENRRKRDELYDQKEASSRGDRVIAIQEPADGNEFFMNLNSANKTLQVLGQVVRNFPGSLSRDLKTDVLNAAQSLGLRTLSAVIESLADDKDDIVQVIQAVMDTLKLKDGVSKSEEAERLYTIFAIRECVTGIMRIVRCIGSEDLNESYKYIEKAPGENTSELIHVAIRAFHYKAFPTGRMANLADGLDKGSFPFLMLRLIAINYMYLYPLSFKDKDKLIAHLALDNRSRAAITASASTSGV